MAGNKCFILDAQIFIWWMKQDKRLKKKVETIIKDPQNIIFLSIACVWEMVIKKRIGKLKLPRNWKETINNSRFEILPINLKHAFILETLPLFHHDLFDRMLIAQAKVEKASLISADKKIFKYDVDIVKA